MKFTILNHANTSPRETQDGQTSFEPLSKTPTFYNQQKNPVRLASLDFFNYLIIVNLF